MENGRKCMCACGWRGLVANLLVADDPFNPGERLTACPECRQTDELRTPCEINSCWKEASCGGTFADGVYRFTCGQHAEWLHKEKPRQSEAEISAREKAPSRLPTAGED